MRRRQPKQLYIFNKKKNCSRIIKIMSRHEGMCNHVSWAFGFTLLNFLSFFFLFFFLHLFNESFSNGTFFNFFFSHFIGLGVFVSFKLRKNVYFRVLFRFRVFLDYHLILYEWFFFFIAISVLKFCKLRISFRNFSVVCCDCRHLA